MKNKRASLLQQSEFTGSLCARLLKQTEECTWVFYSSCQKQTWALIFQAGKIVVEVCAPYLACSTE